MPEQERMPSTARVKCNYWMRGKGSYSYRGELKREISLNKKYLSWKVRHRATLVLKGNDYRKICRTVNMVSFT